MDRHEILDLLLKDHTHDSLIERPELYSVEEDIYQWMFEMRDEWNKALARLMNHYRIDGEELKMEEPEYYWRYEVKNYTEENIRKRTNRGQALF